MSESHPVVQLRVVVEAEDYTEAVHFFRDVLGLREEAAFESDGDAHVTILDAGRATLELANPAQKAMIDCVEVGDTAQVTTRLVDAGAELIAAPVVTPWQSLNSRLTAPAGVQITIFEELEALEERSERDGFGTDESRHK